MVLHAKAVVTVPCHLNHTCILSRVVGVSDHCDWPPEAAALPKVSRSRVDCRSMSPAEVEAQMQSYKQQVRPPLTGQMS